MLAILLLKLLRVTALHDGTPNPSPLELITQLQHENENLLPAHPQPQEALPQLHEAQPPAPVRVQDLRPGQRSGNIIYII